MADPQETDGAISCMNVLVDRFGYVRSRPGFATTYTVADESRIRAMHPAPDGKLLVATVGGIYSITPSSGAVTATTTSSDLPSFATLDDATYFTDGNTTQVRKYSAGAFSSPAGLSGSKADHLGVQPIEDRLVINPTGSSANSTLFFSDPATPETIDSGNTLELTPGDGEAIQAITSFGTELVVFKESKFFVFYGNTTDATGGVIFNYRTVETGLKNIRGPVAVHQTGIYFVANDGVYRTTGGQPIKVSDDISPLFPGSRTELPEPFDTASGLSTIDMDEITGVAVAGSLLYVLVAIGGATPYQFVLDLVTNQWTVMDLPAWCALDGGALTTDTHNSAIFFGGIGSGEDIAALHMSLPGDTDDEGDAISWHYQSGFMDLGSPNSKRIRCVELWGSGSPTVSILTDHGTTDSIAAAVTLGTSPAIARGIHYKSYQGYELSYKLSGTTAAQINRITYTVADERAGQ